MMSYNVTQTLYIFPVYFGMSRKQFSVRNLIQSFQALSYGNKLHANGVENGYSRGRHEEIIAAMIWLRTFLNMLYRPENSAEYVQGYIFIVLHRFRLVLFWT